MFQDLSTLKFLGLASTNCQVFWSSVRTRAESWRSSSAVRSAWQPGHFQSESLRGKRARGLMHPEWLQFVLHPVLCRSIYVVLGIEVRCFAWRCILHTAHMRTRTGSTWVFLSLWSLWCANFSRAGMFDLSESYPESYPESYLRIIPQDKHAEKDSLFWDIPTWWFAVQVQRGVVKCTATKTAMPWFMICNVRICKNATKLCTYNCKHSHLQNVYFSVSDDQWRPGSFGKTLGRPEVTCPGGTGDLTWGSQVASARTCQDV